MPFSVLFSTHIYVIHRPDIDTSCLSSLSVLVCEMAAFVVEHHRNRCILHLHPELLLFLFLFSLFLSCALLLFL